MTSNIYMNCFLSSSMRHMIVGAALVKIFVLTVNTRLVAVTAGQVLWSLQVVWPSPTAGQVITTGLTFSNSWMYGSKQQILVTSGDRKGEWIENLWHITLGLWNPMPRSSRDTRRLPEPVRWLPAIISRDFMPTTVSSHGFYFVWQAVKLGLFLNVHEHQNKIVRWTR